MAMAVLLLLVLLGRLRLRLRLLLLLLRAQLGRRSVVLLVKCRGYGGILGFVGEVSLVR